MDDTDAVLHHYDTIREELRISAGLGRLELLRTREILRRHLPPAPARILDIGGATGVHASWLAGDGYTVHLVDLAPRHVEKARLDLGPLGVTAELGDARKLNLEADSFDAVLLFGPLYHLTEVSDRRLALRETIRVVRPRGVVAVAAINRFASLFDGLARGFLFDPAFRQIVADDLRTGQHRNPEDRPHWFTTAYFHHPHQLRAELEDVGLSIIELVGVEGLAGWLENLAEAWATDEERDVILDASRTVESEPTLLGLSAHLLAVSRTPP